MRDGLDIAALDLLVAVAGYGSVSAASKALGMAQPNATRVLARLERTHGQPLIVRSVRGSALTPRGEALVELARPLLESRDEFCDGLDRLDRRSSLVVAASQTVAETLTGSWLATLCARHPSLTASLQVCNSDEVGRRVSSGTVALGFIESEHHEARLSSQVVARDRLVIVVSIDHPWLDRRTPVSASELAATPLVVREEGSGTRSVLAARLGAVTTALEVSSNTAVLAAVAAGVAPAVVSELAAASVWAAGRVAIVDCDLDFARDLRALWRGARPTGFAAELVGIAGDRVEA